MAVPVLAVRIDFDNDGSFATAGDDVTADVLSDSVTWTRGRSADFSAEATGEASFTLRNDAGTYLGAGMPLPGMPVHIQATYGGSTYPLFYGFIERVTPDPRERTVAITCYDVLRRMGEIDVTVPANAYTSRSARDFRVEALADYERGVRNLLPNPSFETNTTGWAATNGTITRIASDPATASTGSACAEFVWSSGTGNLRAKVYLAPVYHAGLVYQASVYLRSTSGTLIATLGLGYDSNPGGAHGERTITLTTSWTRYQVAYAPTEARASSHASPLMIYINVTSGTYRIDGAMVTRGQAVPDYADSGSGRWPNWCGNGSFDGGSVTGWHAGFTNFVTNFSFETDTTGWVVTTNSFITVAGSSIARTGPTTTPHGSYYALVTTGASGRGTSYAITGTFKSGVPYTAVVYLKLSGTGPVEIGIGSNGTPADVATYSASGTDWTAHAVNWTPSADRTDVILFARNTNTLATWLIDAVFVGSYDAYRTTTTSLCSVVLPGATSAPASSPAHSTTTPKYGSRCLTAGTTAVAGSGFFYDFSNIATYFVSGQQYTASVWLRPSSSMAYEVGFGGSTDGITWASANTTGTATANTWTQVTVSWTPGADYSAASWARAILWIEQTDTTARTVLVDGVRVIPGAAADDFEMAQWSLSTTETDAYLATAYLNGTANSVLSAINGLTFSRHWIVPAVATPWYSYRTSSRADLATKASAETFDDDLADMTTAEIDRGAVVNLIAITDASVTNYYSNSASVTLYGLRPGSAVDGVLFFASDEIPAALATALFTRYAAPRARPRITVVNRFPSQLARELDDLVTINFARLSISGGEYLIQALTTTVSAGGNWWETTYQLEEAP